jgi:hypothetical protein
MGSCIFVLYGMYMVTMNELKATLKVSAQAGKSTVNKTSLESMTQDDDFHEGKRHKSHISNNTSQAAKKSTTPVPTSAVAKLPPKAVLTQNFFAPLRPTDMNMVTIGAGGSQVGRHQ